MHTIARQVSTKLYMFRASLVTCYSNSCTSSNIQRVLTATPGEHSYCCRTCEYHDLLWDGTSISYKVWRNMQVVSVVHVPQAVQRKRHNETATAKQLHDTRTLCVVNRMLSSTVKHAKGHSQRTWRRDARNQQQALVRKTHPR